MVGLRIGPRAKLEDEPSALERSEARIDRVGKTELARRATRWGGPIMAGNLRCAWSGCASKSGPVREDSNRTANLNHE
jgi:hypothetical protein